MRSGIDLAQIRLNLSEPHSDIANTQHGAQQQRSNLGCWPAEQVEHV